MSDLEAVDLRIISYIQEGLSIAAIAARIGVTGPRVNQRLNRMRKLCGNTLYYKNGSRYCLTETGEALLEFGRDVETNWGKFKKQAADIKSNHGQLRVIAIPSLLIQDVLNALDVTRKEFPELRVKLINGTANEMVDLLEKGKADIGLINMPTNLANLSIAHYKDEKLVALTSSSHPIANNNFVKFSQLERHKLIKIDSSNWLSNIINFAIEKSRIVPSFSMTTNDLETAAQMATLSTFGITITLESVALRYAKLNNGKVIYIDDKWANVEMGICTRDQTTLTDAQRYFVDALKKTTNKKR